MFSHKPTSSNPFTVSPDPESANSTEPSEADDHAPASSSSNHSNGSNGGHDDHIRNHPPEDRLAAVRDLLVGDQIDVLQDRFQNLESSLEAHSNALVDQIRSKFDAAHSLYKCDLEDVSENVANLRSEHEKVDGELERVAERLTTMEKQHEELQATVSSQLGDIYEEFSKSVSNFTRAMKEQYQELSTQMVAKKDLSDAFADLSGSLAAAIAQGHSNSSEQEHDGDNNTGN